LARRFRIVRWRASSRSGRPGRNAAERFSGHSLRAGFITDALDRKVDFVTIMKQSGHVKVDTLKEYDRRENDFDAHAGDDFL
jgi:integrase